MDVQGTDSVAKKIDLSSYRKQVRKRRRKCWGKKKKSIKNVINLAPNTVDGIKKLKSYRNKNLRFRETIDVNEAIYSSSFCYGNEKYLFKLQNELVKKINQDDVKGIKFDYDEHVIDGFVIHSFTDRKSFECFAKLSALEFVEKELENRTANNHQKWSVSQDEESLVEQMNSNQEFNGDLNEYYSLNNIPVSKSKNDFFSDSDNENKEFRNEEIISPLKEQVARPRKRKSENFPKNSPKGALAAVLTRTSSRGRVIKPASWMLDDDLNDLIDVEEEKNAKPSYRFPSQVLTPLNDQKQSDGDLQKLPIEGNKFFHTFKKMPNSSQNVVYLANKQKFISNRLKSSLITENSKSFNNSHSSEQIKSNFKSIENKFYEPGKDSTIETPVSEWNSDFFKYHDSLKPAKLISRFTPFGWKPFFIVEEEAKPLKIYETNADHLGPDSTVYIDFLKNDQNQCENIDSSCKENIQMKTIKVGENSKINHATIQSKEKVSKDDFLLSNDSALKKESKQESNNSSTKNDLSSNKSSTTLTSDLNQTFNNSHTKNNRSIHINFPYSEVNFLTQLKFEDNSVNSCKGHKPLLIKIMNRKNKFKISDKYINILTKFYEKQQKRKREVSKKKIDNIKTVLDEKIEDSYKKFCQINGIVYHKKQQNIVVMSKSETRKFFVRSSSRASQSDQQNQYPSNEKKLFLNNSFKQVVSELKSHTASPKVFVLNSSQNNSSTMLPSMASSQPRTLSVAKTPISTTSMPSKPIFRLVLSCDNNKNS